VGLLLNNYYDVTCLSTRVLVGLTMECVLAVVRGTFIDFGVNYLFFLNYFFTIAVLALVFFVNYFTFATTIITRA
jgi:hypothetical protein